MTSITINKKKISSSNIGNPTITELMDYVLDHHVTQKDVITNVAVDGNIIEMAQENQYLLKRLSDCQQIDLTVQSSIELAFEALDSCSNYIDIVIAKIKKLTELYNCNKKERANLLFSEIIEIMDLFVQLMSRIYQTLRDNYGRDALKNKTMQSLEIHLLSVLKALVPAKEKEDIIMLCDLLEYELIDNLTQWKIKAIPELKLVKKDLG